jgi:hypothetical protein
VKKFKWALAAVALVSIMSCSTPNPDGIVQNGVESQMREKDKYIRACYESEYKNTRPKPNGLIVVRITLNEDGDVRDVETLEDTLKNPRLINCLNYIIKSTRFDRSGVTMETFVEYPFVFKNAESD